MNNFEFKISINKNEWLFLEIKIAIFDYVLTKIFCLKKWELKYKTKSYSVLFVCGPISIKLINMNKLNDHIYKVLKENEDKMYSEM